jgi:hypothetical protein
VSVDSVVQAGRAAAESRMTSRAKIRRKTGFTTQDEDTGLEVPVWDVVYTGLPFRLGGVPGGAASSRTIDLGGAQVQEANRVGHMPVTTDNLADGDFIEVTAGENTGRVLRIVEADWQDQSTARRVPVVAEIRPGEWT